jgi:hypothetical protein
MDVATVAACGPLYTPLRPSLLNIGGIEQVTEMIASDSVRFSANGALNELMNPIVRQASDVVPQLLTIESVSAKGW